VHCCHGDDRPDCPIIESLAAEGYAVAHDGKANGPDTKTGLRPGKHQVPRA